MEHTPQRRELTHDGEAVGVRVAVVDDDGQIQLHRQRQLTAQHVPLMLLGRIFLPVVVKPDLADGNGLRVPRHLPQHVDIRRYKRRAVLGMIPHRRVDVGVLLRDRHRLAGGFEVAAGIDDQPHAVLGHGSEQLGAIRVELLVVIMGVGVKDESHVSTSSRRRGWRHPT